MATGDKSESYFCSEKCTNGLELKTRIGTVTTECCQTNNCNTISASMPITTVSSCYIGVIERSVNTVVSKDCTSPQNGFCQVNSRFWFKYPTVDFEI